MNLCATERDVAMPSTVNLDGEIVETDDGVIVIGTGTKEDYVIPIDFSYKGSASQTIYLGEEIGVDEGLIKSFSYSYDNSSKKIVNERVKVYMANTAIGNLSNGWIPESELSLVFDGTVTINEGKGEVTIALTSPFMYTGGNLCVMNVNTVEGKYYMYIKFPQTITNEVRSLTYADDYKEFNYTQTGKQVSAFANIKFTIQQHGIGNVMGSVECGDTPIEAAQLRLTPLGINATTDAAGKFKFGYIPEGKYSIDVVKYGYDDRTLDIDIHDGDNNIDVAIFEKQRCVLKGSVKNSDNNGVENATVTIQGYNNYETTTDAAGQFTINGVYIADDYSLKVRKGGLHTYSTTINVNSDVTLPLIIMESVPLLPANVIALSSATKVNLNWEEPVISNLFRYDDGVATGKMGFYSGDANSVFGAVHRQPAVLNSMSWWTVGTNVKHETVNVLVINIDPNTGKPTSDIIFRQLDVPNIDDQWSSFTFPQEIECPNGFMIAISYKGSVDIATDTGMSEEWPFVPEVNYYAMSCNAAGTYTALSGDKSYNFLIRAEGYITKDVSKNSESNNLTTPFNSNYNSTSTSDQATNAKGYKIWRFSEGDQANEESWTALTPEQITETSYVDHWSAIEKGVYRYAVKAIYANDISSAPAFSNKVSKDMTATVTINVTTNTPINEAGGAVVKLINMDNNPENVYTGTVNNQGIVIIDNVWEGVYTIHITRDGYIPFEATNVEILTHTLSLDYVIDEMVTQPYNLDIVANEYPLERTLNWNFSGEMTDDFESHPDFTINSKGQFNWSYIDSDRLPTDGFTNVTFPNMGLPMAYIIFNPSETTPPMTNPSLQSHSGSKFLATFTAGQLGNSDFIISPELSFASDFTFSFWAKTYMSDYNGLERMKVGYSTTGNDKSDFTNWLTVGDYVEVPVSEWTNYSYTVPANAKYVTIQCVSVDAFIFMVDDISITSKRQVSLSTDEKSLQHYEVYLDGIKQGETDKTTYNLTELSTGSHTAGVKAVYGSATTDMSTIEFSVTGEAVAASVKGVVNANDGMAVSNVNVKIKGYRSYETITNTNGEFNFPAIMAQSGYAIIFSKDGFTKQSKAFDVIAGLDIDLGVIILNEVTSKPKNVVAVEADSNVNISWLASGTPLAKTFRYDDGTIYSGLGSDMGNDKTVVGNVFRTPALLQSMSWITIGTATRVNIFVFDLDEDGNPTKNILYTQENVSTTSGVWSSITFSQQLECPNGFMLAISIASPAIGNISLGMDAGGNIEYPFTPNVGFFSGNYTNGVFEPTGTQFQRNLMIRAEGFDISKKTSVNSFARTVANIQYTFLDEMVIDTLVNISHNDNNRNNDSKSFSGYKVWKLRSSDISDESKWSELTVQPTSNLSFIDENWPSTAMGSYKYAVKSIYSGGLCSEAVFSNVIDKSMIANVTISVKISSTSIAIENAAIKLTNNDGLSDHVYTSQTDATGKAMFPNMYKGLYKLNISADGYAALEKTNVDFSTDDVYTVDYTLNEKLQPPFNLEIVKTDIESERILNWNEDNTISDDFELHTDFTVNSPGRVGWSYIDGDKSTTYVMQNNVEKVYFPNAGSPMAYIVFNPSKTQPVIDGDVWGAHSGNKYMLCMGAQQASNNDWIISPEITFNKPLTVELWVKSATDTYGGLERFRLLYSTTGNAMTDFTHVLNIGEYEEAPTIWTKFIYELPSAAKYVAVNCVSNDKFAFMLDDITISNSHSSSVQDISSTKTILSAIRYEVYLNGEKVSETPNATFKFANLTKGKHTAGVKAIYVSGESEMATIGFDVDLSDVMTMKESHMLTIYPNPVKNLLNIKGEYDSLEIYNVLGEVVIISDGENKINVSGLTPGTYIIKAYYNENVQTYKIIK